MRNILCAIFVASVSFANVSFAADCKKDDILKLVNKACDLITAQGDKAYEELSKPEFNGACDSYVWVHSYKGEEIIPTFHPANPSLMNKNMADLKDPKGKPIFGTFRKAAPKKGDAAWVTYVWPKAKQENPIPKCSYIKNCDGTLTAGMGIYGDCPSIGVKKFE